MSNELFSALKNLSSLIDYENVQTITPKYSVLEKDVKRFEEISNSSLFNKYSNSIALLNQTSNLKSIKKDLKVNTLKIYYKYSKSFDLKKMTFSLIKNALNTIKTSFGVIPGAPTEIIEGLLETVSSHKKRITFYHLEDANPQILWSNRIQEAFSSITAEYIKLAQTDSTVKDIAFKKWNEFIAEMQKDIDKNKPT